MISCTVSLCAVVAFTLVVVTQSVGVVDENEECDLYKGSWVVDESYPLYSSANCPFITLQQFNCTGNGRLDLQYQKYRWQPNNCELPMWDGVEFVEMVRGKSIMFVGDSISMNQWMSLACMIYAANPNAPYQPPKRTGPLSIIVFPEWNVTLTYQRNAFIVDIAIESGVRVLKLDSVALSSQQWLQTDILIFDTWHWWLYTGRKQPWDLIREGNLTTMDMDRFEAYEKALRTWGRWVDQNVAEKVEIFFQGVSPDHWNASTWGMPETQRCGGEDEPLMQSIEENNNTTRADVILKEVLTSINKTIHLLGINELSRYRVDGHPSIYGNPSHRGMDCTHWCLPGIPDIWNQLLYAILSPTFVTTSFHLKVKLF